jgi:hypothetical protein
LGEIGKLTSKSIALDIKSLYGVRALSEKKPYDHGGVHVREEYQKTG